MADNEPQFPQDQYDEEPVIGDAPPTANTLLSNKVYDALKFCALVLFPAVATAYGALAAIWGLPASEQVVGTIVVVDTLLGVVLHFDTKQYNNSDARFDGAINVSPHPDDPENSSNVRVQLDPASLAKKDEITVKVNRAEGV